MAHCNTILHQMLKLIPRHVFSKLDSEHGTGRSARLLPAGINASTCCLCNSPADAASGME